MDDDITRYRTLILFDGSTFFLSDPNGDVAAGQTQGFFHDDVRHLSLWRLLVDGRPLEAITSRTVDYYSGRITCVSQKENPPFSVRRDRFVTDGVHEDIVLTNHQTRELQVRLELRFEADFADVLEAQQQPQRQESDSTAVERAERAVTLRYDRDGFRRSTIIAFSEAGQVSEGAAVFEVQVPPHGQWQTCVDISCGSDEGERKPLLRCGSFRGGEPEMPLSLDEWFACAPELETDDPALARTYGQSLLDLASLRIRPGQVMRHAMPAGGIPWFMAIFGRDSIIAAFEALPFAPTLAESTLEALAALQASEWNDFRDAEPGKILHEFRRGKCAALGLTPHSPYYGTHDATQLWLILLDEYERWSGDRELVRRLEANARRALEWIDRYGDLDGDGYLEYRSRSEKGLNNHSWKDSDDSIRFSDGRVAPPPIATCEIQGYTYDARLRAARLAREIWQDEELARTQESEAAALRDRFNSDFWNDQEQTFLLALAGPGKERVDATTSNAGQLLWTGIVDVERAAPLAERLLRPDLFSGWGIRTMSSKEAPFSPLGYHTGCVWPHDTALIAWGMRRYGFHDEAARVAEALLKAAAAFRHQLPELFGGFERDAAEVPVRYPSALTPQAWAAGAALLALRTLLGMEAIGEELRSEPLRGRGGRLALRGVPFRGRREDVGAGSKG
jgi:glycogen debranching enzyme